jgi:hypothetical protein
VREFVMEKFDMKRACADTTEGHGTLKIIRKLSFAILLFASVVPFLAAQTLPSKVEIVATMSLVNDWFMARHPDPGANIVDSGGTVRPGNIWTRATYFEGVMAMYRVNPDPKLYDYAVRWGESHAWGLRSGTSTRNADDQCCGQAYVEIYGIDPQAARIRDITSSISSMANSTARNDWWWIDAIHMSMPVFAKLGVVHNSVAYFNKMYDLYDYTKRSRGANGLYSTTDHLWWRDADFDPPLHRTEREVLLLVAWKRLGFRRSRPRTRCSSRERRAPDRVHPELYGNGESPARSPEVGRILERQPPRSGPLRRKGNLGYRNVHVRDGLGDQSRVARCGDVRSGRRARLERDGERSVTAAVTGPCDIYASGGTPCVISIIYDQSGRGNHLKVATGDQRDGHVPDRLLSAHRGHRERNHGNHVHQRAAGGKQHRDDVQSVRPR